MTAISDMARSYFERVRQKDAAALGRMFAEHGMLALPGGDAVVGPTAIAAYYRKVFAQVAPNPQVQALGVDGRRCLVEIVARRPDGSSNRVVDVFTTNADGEIVELAVFTRSDAPPASSGQAA